MLELSSRNLPLIQEVNFFVRPALCLRNPEENPYKAERGKALFNR